MAQTKLPRGTETRLAPSDFTCRWCSPCAKEPQNKIQIREKTILMTLQRAARLIQCRESYLVTTHEFSILSIPYPVCPRHLRTLSLIHSTYIQAITDTHVYIPRAREKETGSAADSLAHLVSPTSHCEMCLKTYSEQMLEGCPVPKGRHLVPWQRTLSLFPNTT